MASKLFYWFVVITIWPRPFADTTRMLRLNVSIFLRLLLIRYNAYTELLMDLRSQLKMMNTMASLKHNLNEEQTALLDKFIVDITKVINKRKSRADSIEWELTELWNTDDVLKRVRAICIFIVNGTQNNTEADALFSKITRSHYIIFKSRKFITRDLWFTMMSGCVVSMVGCMLYYYVGSSTTLLEMAIHNSLTLTIQILLASAFFNGVRNNLRFFSANPIEYTEIYNLDGRYYDNFMGIDNLDFLLDGHDIHDTAERVRQFREAVDSSIITYSRLKVYTRVIRPYTLRNIDMEDSSVIRIMELTKDIRLAHETNDKSLETAKDLLHTLG